MAYITLILLVAYITDTAGGLHHSDTAGGLHHSDTAGGLHHSDTAGGLHHSDTAGGLHHSVFQHFTTVVLISEEANDPMLTNLITTTTITVLKGGIRDLVNRLTVPGTVSNTHSHVATVQCIKE